MPATVSVIIVAITGLALTLGTEKTVSTYERQFKKQLKTAGGKKKKWPSK